MSRISPLRLIIGLLVTVVCVNIAFLFVSMKHADPVVPSYESEAR